MKKSLWALMIFCLAAALMLGGQSALAAKQFVTIGTGGVTGVYFPVGKAIAKLVNAQGDTYGLRVTVESTGGLAFNINAVMNGDMDLGVAQSDRQFEAVKGLSEWKNKGPQKGLRSVQSFAYDMRTAILPFMFIFNSHLLLIGVDSWLMAAWVMFSGLAAMFAFAGATQGYLAARGQGKGKLTLRLQGLPHILYRTAKQRVVIHV